MKKNVQGPRPKKRKNEYHVRFQNYYTRSHPSNMEQQRDNVEFPNNSYNTNDNTHFNDDDHGYGRPTRFHAHQSREIANPRSYNEGNGDFVVDQRCQRNGTHDTSYNNDQSIPWTNYDQVNHSRDTQKPYFGKQRYNKQKWNRCPTPRSNRYKQWRGSNRGFRHGNESRSPNYFKGRSLVWNREGSFKGDVWKPLSRSPNVPNDGIKPSVGEANEENILPGTPPLENMVATGVYDGHGEADGNKNNIATTSSNHTSMRMEDLSARGCPPMEDVAPCYFSLMKDKKMICRTQCRNPPIQPPDTCWNIEIVKKSVELGSLRQFCVFPAFESSCQKNEWNRFLTFLYKNEKVATIEFEGLKICVLPPKDTKPTKTDDGLYFNHALVAYEILQEAQGTSLDQNHAETDINVAYKKTMSSERKMSATTETCTKSRMVNSPRVATQTQSTHFIDIPAVDSDAHVKGSNSTEKGACSSVTKYPEAVNNTLERNFVRADPSYLKTLGQAHSGWIFGGIAELVDNSRDANASKLDIAIETVYNKRGGCEVPMLSVIDNGDGMTYQQILRMVSFGHKQPDEDSQERIGRFGVGFKTGAMRLGRDALVLTQTTESRSIAFLSQSLNEGKDNVEIPIVSYRRQAQCMEFDTTVQSEALALYNLGAIKEFSPFNEYLIGEKSALFQNNTGTQIYIWNLDKWGSDYSLEWQSGTRGSSSFYQGDIFVRSRRVRSRPGQTSRKVPLDYSLRSYLEVIFLEPRMKILVQGSLVKSRPLAKSLNETNVVNGEILGKHVQLTLGRCQLEWELANCGVFLYWHGRLIEAYKRVGGMIHSADIGRGVVGVIDVSELMDDGNNSAWVHSNKQGFQDCEAYAHLEEWLGSQVDEYWDTHFDVVQLKKSNTSYKPDFDWVQCEKCRKWRKLTEGFDSSTLAVDWFCYMDPFNGRCETPEEKVDHGVITTAIKRKGYFSEVPDHTEGVQTTNDRTKGNTVDSSNPIEENNMEDSQYWKKRLRRGTQRTCAKK